MLERIDWDSFEFKKASSVFLYSFPNPCAFYVKSHYAPFWCDLCGSSNHNIVSCPFYACYTQSDSSFPLAQCTGLEGGEPFGLIAKFDVVIHIMHRMILLMWCII